MWLILALASALFSGTTAVLAKYGIKRVEPELAVALRSVVILAFAWLTLLMSGSWSEIGSLTAMAALFPLLSGTANALAWFCYFKALQNGSVNQVAAIDKAGIVITMVGGWLLLGESMTGAKGLSIALILCGVWLMIEKETTDKGIRSSASQDQHTSSHLSGKHPLIWAVSSALFASAATLLSKAGSVNLDANIAFAIRTGVMLVLAWGTVILKKGIVKRTEVDSIGRKSMLFVGLSGLTTALAWFSYFRSLASPEAEAGVVQPIDKLSLLVSVLLARWFLKEELKPRTVAGLALLTAGILVLLI